MSYQIEYFTDARGEKPVLNFIYGLSAKHKAKVMVYLEQLQSEGVNLKEPYTRHLGDKLRELRIEYERNQYRIIHFFYIEKKIVLLHAFVKKTKKTPRREIDIAKSRLNKFLEQE